MIWLVPAAWIGALAIAAPIVVHLLARPRAIAQPFPTLRFLPDTSRPALRRRRIDERVLLLVRCAIVFAAAAAFAGPLIMTNARRAIRNARLIREIVSDTDAAPLRTNLWRAIADLDFAPPGRREIVVRSAFPIGSITDADIAAVPESIGLTFERSGALPATRTVEAPPVLASTVRVSRRTVLDGPRTSVVDGDATATVAPIEIVAPADRRDVLGAVLAERVPATPPDRHARVLVTGAPSFAASVGAAEPIRVPWIADAVARMARDRDLQDVMSRQTTSLNAPAFNHEPWHVVAVNRDAQPIAAAAADADGRLIVATADVDDDLALALFVRAALNAMASPARHEADVIAIGDAQLRAWTRPPGPAPAPRLDAVEIDDRRVLWIAVLMLMGMELWMRRRV